jgi:serine/threonine-protein kinase
VLASLNHPNIAAIYGADDRALIIELVGGPTLAERIAEGPIPPEEALPMACQIAEALEYAHERGVIHRDLKPANVKITPEGRVKVLDFGLAAVAHASAPGAVDPPSSATLTMRATQLGTIMGTAAYMSPEQASGKVVDKRTDIWSFGIVLWEMLTGHRLFDGETISHTLADLLRGEIDWKKLPQNTPPAILNLLKRCLDRDTKGRLRDIGEARIVLESPHEPTPAGFQPAVRAAWVTSTAIFAIAASALTVLYFRQTPAPTQLMRFTVSPPEKGSFSFWMGISPDGRHLGFTAAGADGISRLWVRSWIHWQRGHCLALRGK